MKSRIDLMDNGMTIVMKLSEGNPGAVTVLVEMMTNGAEIDPRSAFGPLSGALNLDSYGIYGSRIWMLYKDVCKQNLNATLGMLRSTQMGIIPQHILDHAIDNYGEGLDVQATLEKLKVELPEFVIA
jgi:hypothetical protein